MRILLAEDDPVLSDQIKTALAAEGRAVDTADNGEDAHFLGANEPYDLVVLDIGLPTRDGISVLKEWRKDKVETPVLILTARDSWSDKVDGLDAGADDYMAKPFHMPELSARIRAMLRRQAGRSNPVFQKGPIVFDTCPVAHEAQSTHRGGIAHHCSDSHHSGRRAMATRQVQR